MNSSHDNLILISVALIAPIVFLLQILSGWQKGLIQTAFKPVSLLLGIFFAFAFSDLLLPLSKRILNYPESILATLNFPFVALLATTMVHAALVSVYRVRKKNDSESLSRRSKITGGILGGLIGGFFALALLFSVWFGGRWAHLIGQTDDGSINPLIVNLQHANNEFSRTPWSIIFPRLDPLSEKDYRVIGKAFRVVNDEQLLERFLKHPKAQELVNNPKVKALLNNREVRILCLQRNLHGLLLHQRIHDVADDRVVHAIFQQTDIEGLLDDVIG